MGQKSLSVLHRADSSMIWNSYIYNKQYKWLSYNLWFAYIHFYKIIFFCNSYSYVFLNHLSNSKNMQLITLSKKYMHLSKTSIRFSYYIDLYCLEFYNYLLLINIYFLTNLFFFKINKKRKKNKLTKSNKLKFTFF